MKQRANLFDSNDVICLLLVHVDLVQAELAAPLPDEEQPHLQTREHCCLVLSTYGCNVRVLAGGNNPAARVKFDFCADLSVEGEGVRVVNFVLRGV